MSRSLCNFEQTRERYRRMMLGRRPYQIQMSRNYALMNALSAWAVALRCPHCGRTGSGTVSEDRHDQQEEPRLRIDSLPRGFVAVELRPGAGQDIRCATCNSSALK
jgi:hypothetical protein